MPSSKVDKLIYAYVESLYQHSIGFQNYSQDSKDRYMAKDVCYVYGELLYPSVVKMIKRLSLNANDVLLDLGSGLGKFALQMFMRSAVQKVIGIEATEPLYLQSTQKIQQAQRDVPFFWAGRDFVLIGDNFLTQDWSEANIVYTCSTCFTAELLEKISVKINNTPSIQQVLSLRPMPVLDRLKLYDVFSVECSWDSALCFWYKN